MREQYIESVVEMSQKGSSAARATAPAALSRQLSCISEPADDADVPNYHRDDFARGLSRQGTRDSFTTQRRGTNDSLSTLRRGTNDSISTLRRGTNDSVTTLRRGTNESLYQQLPLRRGTQEGKRQTHPQTHLHTHPHQHFQIRIIRSYRL